MRRYLSTREAAELLGLSNRTLDRYRVTGAGPAFHKFGNSVRYRRSDLRKWARERRRRSTSDDGGDGRARRRPRGARHRSHSPAKPGAATAGVGTDRSRG